MKEVFEIKGHEYNDYLIGFVISTNLGDVNAQFESCYSNHPSPTFRLYLRCAGDESADVLDADEEEEVLNYIRQSEELREAERIYTKAMYNGMEYNHSYPLRFSEIREWADK